MHTDNHLNTVTELQLSNILHRRHRVLILLPPSEEDLIRRMAQAVDASGCVPIVPEDDYRWKTLLRLAFVKRTETVIGTAQLLMGLLKIAKATNTPLFIHDVILCGEEKMWMQDDLRRSLDCRIWNLEQRLKQRIEADKYTHSMHNELEDMLLGCPDVLDYSMDITECGNSLEVVILNNQKMTVLPSCAKLLIRKWNPEIDVPFSAKKQ